MAGGAGGGEEGFAEGEVGLAFDAGLTLGGDEGLGFAGGVAPAAEEALGGGAEGFAPVSALEVLGGEKEAELILGSGAVESEEKRLILILVGNVGMKKWSRGRTAASQRAVAVVPTQFSDGVTRWGNILR